ncbi:hypothetical protein [Chitinophaga filiformis]|uniref:Uncharacterized protein n=1 Tax=Chitinophaga filiformis TaxID=104663 RepID=A0A1G7I2W7_CHIFI|nr:hypothetical protein [Chitinophaga filiformis]SDF07081.1 hypothetical protein SAMN04488121_101701 [Chitinophaga filiformis]
MTELASSITRLRRGQYTDVIGAGGGTALLMFAERLPDTYWFKTYLILAAPSLSVSFSKITNIILSECNIIYDMLRESQYERSILRSLKLLRKNPLASQASIEKLEQAYLDVSIKCIENKIFKLDKMKSD